MGENRKKNKLRNALDESDLSTKDYERIGRAIESVVIAGYVGKRRLAIANFLRGIAFGLGSALGATVLLVIVIYLLSLFSEVPFIGRLAESVEETVRQAQ